MYCKHLRKHVLCVILAQNNHVDNLRIVLLGKTGAGKSAAGNTILGRRAFAVKCSPESVTRKCDAHDATVDGQKITVVDTPGLYDTLMEKEDLKSRIEELFNNSGDGIHAVLLVVKVGVRFTPEEQNTVQWIKDNFGEDVSQNTIVLFTNGDELENDDMTIEQYINKSEKLQKLVEQCNERYQVFNNHKRDGNQVTELLGKINTMIQETSYKRYTKKKYEETQKKLSRIGLTTGAVLGAGAGGGTAVLTGATAVKVGAAAAVGGVGGVAVVGAVGAVGVGTMIYRKFTKND